MNKEFVRKSLIETAQLALEKHGIVYYGHLVRVNGYFRELAALLPPGLLTVDELRDGDLLAYLHDIVEDGYLTYDDLRALGYSERVIKLVKALTRDPAKEVYQTKIEAIATSGDLVRILVKLADNRDNSTDARIEDLPPEKRSIIKRYRRARRTLFNGLKALLLARGCTDENISMIEQWLGNLDSGKW